MKSSICIITEANEKVATGHFIEACSIADMLSSKGMDVKVFVNNDIQKPLLSKLNCSYAFYSDINECIGKVKNFDIIITDLRRVDNEFIKALKCKVSAVIVCIDELGFTKLDCDVIINNMIDSYYHVYDLSLGTKLYAGADYMIMKPEFARLNKAERLVKDKIETVVICMGGADTPGTTMRVLQGLEGFNGNINVVVGGGFMHINALKEFNRDNIRVYYNIDNVYNLFAQADIAFCSGGNVLYELACIGTPAVTVYTNPHEKRNADCFASRGFGICIGQAEEIKQKDISAALDYFNMSEVCRRHMLAGKSIVDGLAIERIRNIIEQFSLAHANN